MLDKIQLYCVLNTSCIFCRCEKVKNKLNKMERNHKNSLKKSRQQIVDVSINIMIYDSIKIFLFKILDKPNFCNDFILAT